MPTETLVISTRDVLPTISYAEQYARDHTEPMAPVQPSDSAMVREANLMTMRSQVERRFAQAPADVDR